MSTITKEWLQQKISDMEAARDEIPFGLDEHESNMLEVLNLALASLEAEPVAWLLSGGGAKNNVSFDSGNAYADPPREVTPLYTAPPAPVSAPEPIKRNDADGWWMYKGRRIGGGCAEWYNRALDDCRAAMLQGAAGNSPAIPDGYALVPVEPTKEMIDAGWSYYMTTKSPSSIGVYGAMLAAAPQQEVK